MKSINYLSLAVLALFSACSKSDVAMSTETPKAQVAFSSPSVHAHYHPGDTVHFAAFASAPEMMHGYDLILLHQKSGDTLFAFHGHDHGKEIKVDTSWIHTEQSEALVRTQITVYVDHDKNFVRDEIEFHLLDN